MPGKSLAEHLRLQLWVLVAIVVVSAVRWILTSADMAAGRWATIIWILVIGSVHYGVVAHTSRFGRDRQLYPFNLVQHNIFTVPEFTQGPVQGQDGRSWIHAGAHLVVAGAIVLPLVGWLLSSIVMFLTRKVAPRAS